jgi:hypothetical protein
MTNVGLNPTIGHRRPGILAFLVFWSPVLFLAITVAVMGVFHGAIAAIATAVLEVVTLFLLALVS